MGREIKVMCPRCKHSWWADKFVAIICPKCGEIVKE